MSDMDKFLSEISGKTDREKAQSAMRRGRAGSRRAGLRPVSKLKAPAIYDIGGQGKHMLDARGQGLYANHHVIDDDADDLEFVRQTWNDVPVEPESEDEGGEEEDGRGDEDYHTEETDSSDAGEALSDECAASPPSSQSPSGSASFW